jgi:hypothetical protein
MIWMKRELRAEEFWIVFKKISYISDKFSQEIIKYILAKSRRLLATLWQRHRADGCQYSLENFPEDIEYTLFVGALMAS